VTSLSFKTLTGKKNPTKQIKCLLPYLLIRRQ